MLPPIEEFREWLESLPPEEIVGTTCNDCNCPYFRYLLFEMFEVVSVGDDLVMMKHSGALELPLYAKRFIYHLDRSTLRREAFVTAAQCLSILGKVEKELGHD